MKQELQKTHLANLPSPLFSALDIRRLLPVLLVLVLPAIGGLHGLSGEGRGRREEARPFAAGSEKKEKGRRSRGRGQL